MTPAPSAPMYKAMILVEAEIYVGEKCVVLPSRQSD